MFHRSEQIRPEPARPALQGVEGIPGEDLGEELVSEIARVLCAVPGALNERLDRRVIRLAQLPQRLLRLKRLAPRSQDPRPMRGDKRGTGGTRTAVVAHHG